MSTADKCAGCEHARSNHAGKRMADSLCMVPGCRGCFGFRLDFGQHEIEQVPIFSLPKMCVLCAAAANKWLDYTPPPAPIQLMTIGNRVRDVSDRMRRRVEDYYDTIRFEQNLIHKFCAEGNHVKNEESE